MKYNISKILLIIIVIFSKSCVITQKIGRDDIILKENKIFIDGQLLKKDSLTPLIVQKKNNYLFGIPISALIYESTKKNPDSVFNNWLYKYPKRSKRLSKIFSEKQVSQIRKYIKDFNNWKKRNSEKLKLSIQPKIMFHQRT